MAKNGENSEAEPQLDPDFEAALQAALALEPTERIDRLGQLAEQLKNNLGESA